MTGTLGHDATGSPDIGARLVLAVRRFGGLLAKAGFGVFLFFAAISALVATTVIGLMLAIAAVFLTFALGSGRKSPRTTGGSDTLEARRTADGWIIET